jgi:hypothetical protein
MTVPATTRKAGPFTGNGSTRADLASVETVLSSGYTVSMNADQVASPGGSVTLAAALTTGYKLSVTGNLPYDQTLALPGGGNFNPTVLENDLDRVAMQIQQLNEAISRAVVASVTSGTDPSTLAATLIAAAASASASAASATSTLNTFKGQYYGPLASDPTLDPLGAAMTAGDLYFNTTSNTVKVYSGSTWADVTASVSVPYQLASGTGAQTVYTLSSAPGVVGNLQVSIGGVIQVPTVDYTLSSTTVTFTSAPPTGTNNIFFRWILAQALNVPADASVTTAKIDPAGVALPSASTATTQAAADNSTKLATTAYADRVGALLRPQIQPLPWSRASNALTIAAQQYSLAFKTSLTSGAVATVTGTPAALTIPSGATLGTVSAVQSTIIVAVLNNAGTLEYTVQNLAGGSDMSETGVISTTAISAGATANNVWYSNTARTNVPYAIVGRIDSTQTTAGTWATDPSLVQGVGGQALTAMSSIGYGQTDQDVTGSRTSGTVYYNTTGRPIEVRTGLSASGTNTLTRNGVTVGYNNAAAGALATLSAIIPHGWSYSCTFTAALAFWRELR